MDKLDAMNLSPFFSAIIISAEAGVAKPSPEIFRMACDKLEARPCDCYFIGDRIDLDIEGSVNAGIRPVWLNRNRSPRPDMPGLLEIGSLTELVNLPRATG